MPNRYIRASAIESEAVNSLSDAAEVFYRRLLNRVDDFGRFTANPALLRASLYPLRLSTVTEKTIVGLLKECEDAGLVFPYIADGKMLLVINKWEQGRAKSSEYPSPPDALCERMRTYVYTSKQTRAYAPDSDTDTDSDADTSKQGKPACVRARDDLFDALALAEGSDPFQLTKAHAKRIGVALAEIKRVAPSLTPHEIQRRSRIYASVMPSGTRCTASALAANWAKCGGAPLPRQVAPDVVEQPPPTNWRVTMERLYPDNAVNRENRSWAEVPDAIKAEVRAQS